jgi:hypothetical protein
MRLHSHPAQDDLGVLRPRPGVLVAEGWRGRPSSRVLTHDGRYVQIPRDAVEFIAHLQTQPLGVTVAQAAEAFADVKFDRLVEFGVVEWIPANGRSVSRSLVADLWRRNISAQWRLRQKGWRAIAPRLQSPDAQATPQGPRPVWLDEIEAAARISNGLPGTSRRCTAVALSIDGFLRSAGVPSANVIVTTPEQMLFHSYVVSNGNVVDPSDTLVEGSRMVPVVDAD